MYLDGSVLTAGALRLMQLLLNPFIQAGLQSAALPNNGVPYGIAAVPATPVTAPPRQLSGGDLISLLSTLGIGNPAGAFSSTGSLGNGGPMGSFMGSGSLGSNGGPMGSLMGSGSLGSNGGPMGSLMGSGSLGSNGGPMGSFMGSGSLNNGVSPMNPMAAFPSTGALGAMQSFTSSGTVLPGSMTAANMASMPPLPYAPWLAQLTQPAPAMANIPGSPVYVPPSAVPTLLTPPAAAPSTPSSSTGSLASGALSVLEEAIAPYLNASSSAMTPSNVADLEMASPTPIATIYSVLGSVWSGIRVVVVNFAASVVVMGAAQLVRLVVDNLPIILRLFGLTRASMARVIVDGVTRAQCLERAACLLGQHASIYPQTPDVLRWLRSPDPASPEHPVWKAFRSAAEGAAMQCEAFSC